MPVPRTCAALLGGLDHAHADAVLDRTAGVLVLELQVQLAGAGIQAPGLDDGRIADEFEDGGMDRHAALAEKHGARLSHRRGACQAEPARPGRSRTATDDERSEEHQSELKSLK